MDGLILLRLSGCRVYRKEHKRRALGRIPFKIGDSVELSVGM